MASFKIILGVLFGILVSAIVVLGLISYQTNMAVTDTADMIEHTYKVLDVAEEISSLSKDLQLEGNGVFISGDPAFIRPYNTAKGQVLTELENLRSLILDNESQVNRVDSLENILKDLTLFGDSALTFYDQSQSAQAVNLESDRIILHRINRSNYFRTKIRALVNNIKAEEKELLLLRQRANQNSIEAFDRAFMQLLAGITILLIATFLIIRYNFNKRVRAQRELKRANELFTRLFHESPIGLVICDLDSGIITDCNRTFAELINYDRKEAIGKTAMMLGIIERESERSSIVDCVTENGVVRDVEMTLKPKDREHIWVSVSSQLTNVQDKKCLLSAILDMTSHKKAEEGIKKALATEVELNKMKSNFVSMASHEFRTPLTTILSSAFLLENYLPDEKQEKVVKHITRIKSSVNNLTSILDDFLSVSKIEEGKIKPRIEKLDLKSYMEDLCRNFKNFAKPGQSIIYHHEGITDAYIDPVLLSSIMHNLVSNAIKYSPEDSHIHIYSDLNHQIRLSVKDSGIGIPGEDQAYLFDRFYRASNAGTVQGTGLGLHIMKHYVDMLKGQVEVYSEVGKGTEFKLTFENTPDNA